MALEKASITNLQTGEQIAVMFNPEEYALEASNSFAEIGIPGLRTPPLQYIRGNSRTLSMELFFDSYERRTDVRAETQKFTGLLEQNPTIQAPPLLLFAWGGFNFRCVLESISQRFTMFLNNGTPVRATFTVSFKEYQPIEVETRSGLFLGPPTVRTIAGGETLSKLAGEYLGDPGAWREIAELNNIDDPLNVDAGTLLLIPSRRSETRR